MWYVFDNITRELQQNVEKNFRFTESLENRIAHFAKKRRIEISKNEEE